MPRELPQTPSLEHLRKEAKALVRLHCAHDPEAAALLAGLHPALGGHAPRRILAKPLQLCDAQLAIARQYGFSSWADLKAHIDSVTGAHAAMTAPVDTSLIADPGYRGRLAAQKGLPPVGAAAVNRYGMRYSVIDHAFAMTLASVARVGDGEPTPVIEELLPVISFTSMSQRLSDLYIETDCCTSKELVFMDSMPALHPGSAAPDLHQVVTTQDPRCLVFHLDATNLHETILAHELGHVWIEMVEGCEDFRVPRFLADTPKAMQFELIQSFVLDFRVNALLQQRGFDLTIVDAAYCDAIVHIADRCARGDRPRTERTAAALTNTVAAAMLGHDRWPASAVRCLDACLGQIRIGLPDVYRAARAFVASVEKHGVADRESIRRVIDECALVSFGLTGDDFDAERDLEERPPTEWMRDKHPDFLADLPVPMKLWVWRAMAKQGIGPRVEYRMVPISRGILEITVRDTSGRQPAPARLNLCIPVAQVGGHPLQRPLSPGQRPCVPATAPSRAGLPAPAQPPMAVCGPSQPHPGLPAPDQPPQVGFRPTPPGLPGMVIPQPTAVPVPWDPLGMVPQGGMLSAGRRYMPGVGRWISRVGFEALGHEHPYAYAHNNPVRYVDPGGDTPVPIGDRPVGAAASRVPTKPNVDAVGQARRGDRRGPVAVARGFLFVLTEELPAVGKRTVIRKADVIPINFSFVPKYPRGTLSLAEHVRGVNLEQSQLLSASTWPFGAPNIRGRAFILSVQDVRMHSTPAIISHLEQWAIAHLPTLNSAGRRALRTQVDRTKFLVEQIEREVLVEGATPPGSAGLLRPAHEAYVKSAETMWAHCEGKGLSTAQLQQLQQELAALGRSYTRARVLGRAGRVLTVAGFAVSAVDLVEAGQQSRAQRSLRPLGTEAARQAGGWTGAYVGLEAGFVVGAAVGIETGPFAVVTGLIGSIVGGAAGYGAPGWVAHLIERVHRSVDRFEAGLGAELSLGYRNEYYRRGGQ